MYQLSGIYFTSICSISVRLFPSRFSTWRYAGPAEPSHCPIGFEMTRLIPITIRSACHFEDHPRSMIALIFPPYWRNIAPIPKSAMMNNEMVCFGKCWYKYRAEKSMINHTPPTNPRSALRE